MCAQRRYKKGGEGAGDNIALKETKSKNARGVGSGGRLLLEDIE